MNSPKVFIIAAISKDRVLGKNGKMPWQIPEDLKRFKQLTTGHVIIMGRKTFESIGKPLPNRTNIVITRDKNYQSKGVLVVHSFEEALNEAKNIEKEEIFIIGGGKIYQQALSFADKIYLTIVEGTFEGDTFFPDYSQFNLISEETRGDGNYNFHFLNLER